MGLVIYNSYGISIIQLYQISDNICHSYSPKPKLSSNFTQNNASLSCHIYFLKYFKWKQYDNMCIVSVDIALYMACGAVYAPMEMKFIFLLVLIVSRVGDRKISKHTFRGNPTIRKLHTSQYYTPSTWTYP